jgi:small nuclear ribonucleoprotein (snRNP)-like protein
MGGRQWKAKLSNIIKSQKQNKFLHPNSYRFKRGISMSTVAGRRFHEELGLLLQKPVTVVTTTGKTYAGNLIGYDPDTMSLCLADAKDEAGLSLVRVFINGSIVAQVFTTEKPFDLRGLAERLEKVFPKMVKLYEDAGVIVVMDKIRLTEKGLIEGTGPAAERVQRVYEEFMRAATK